MTELQGAVALAQLSRVGEFTSRRNELGTLWKNYLRDVPGISTQTVAPGSKHSYFLALFASTSACCPVPHRTFPRP